VDWCLRGANLLRMRRTVWLRHASMRRSIRRCCYRRGSVESRTAPVLKGKYAQARSLLQRHCGSIRTTPLPKRCWLPCRISKRRSSWRQRSGLNRASYRTNWANWVKWPPFYARDTTQNTYPAKHGQKRTPRPMAPRRRRFEVAHRRFQPHPSA